MQMFTFISILTNTNLILFLKESIQEYLLSIECYLLVTISSFSQLKASFSSLSIIKNLHLICLHL